LRDNQLYGLHLRRQAALERFIADFYHAPSHLVIEVDGDVHAERVERDEARTEWFKSHGCRVIRFTNQDVLRRMEAVLEKIAEECRKAR
jgi:very-short-patch-repair endonuclease